MTDSEKKNASQFPKRYYARHMQPGICGYGTENVLVDTDAVKHMLGNEAIGKPVYILHQDVDLKTMKDKSAGYIIDSFYNEMDGWGWFEILAIDDEVHAAVSKGWSVSNAYVPTEWGKGGTKNNVPFDREIVNGQFTHLAIVPDPRYEEACIMTPDQFKAYQATKKQQLDELRNSANETSEGKSMFFKMKKEPVTVVDDETLTEIDGQQISIGDMRKELINAKSKAKKNADEANIDDEELENAMVDCDGEKMTVKEMKNRYSKMNSEKKNAEAEKKNADEAAAKEAEEKKNAEAERDDEDDAEEESGEKGDRKEKKNSHFDELKNAHQRGPVTSTVVIETGMDKLQRGKQAYGS